jgi:hypothetical protein
MATQLDATTDAPSTGVDSNVASRALINEVNNDRSGTKSSDIKTTDERSDHQVNSVFGSLTIVDDSKDNGPAAKGDTVTPGGGDSKAAAPVGDDSKATGPAAIGDAAMPVVEGKAQDVMSSVAADKVSAALPVTNSIWSIFDRGPSEDDKQSLRDLAQHARDKVAEQLEPEKKAHVEQLADGIKDDKAKEQFMRDIETVEHRNPPISTADRGRLYNQVERLMEAGDNPNVPLTADDRSKLAQEIMHKAADPTSIDQGIKGTCNVATVESRTFTRDPSAAAKVIVDIATTGEYTSPDGTKVKPDPGSIKSDIEVQNPSGVFKNPRDHADQIFQVTAVNAAWQTHDLQVHDGHGGTRTYPKATVEYRQTDPATGEANGEGLYDKSKNPPERIMENGQPVDQPHLDGNQITDVSNLITGKNEKDFVIEHSGPEAADKTFKVGSEAELKDKLKSMKEHGELPAIIMVNIGNAPFWGENVSLKPGSLPPKSGVNGEHVVTVTDYDEKTGLVSLDNQWGKGRDHIGASGISTGDLYLATMPPGNQETIDTLQRDVKWNRDNHSINTSKELELLRQENVGGKLSEADFRSQADKTMDSARKRWHANGTKEDDIERKQAEENYAKIIKTLDRPRIIHMQ